MNQDKPLKFMVFMMNANVNTVLRMFGDIAPMFSIT